MYRSIAVLTTQFLYNTCCSLLVCIGLTSQLGILMRHNTIQYMYNTIQYNKIQYDNTIKYMYNTIQCNKNTMQCNAIQYNA